jgi:hypothetical protein
MNIARTWAQLTTRAVKFETGNIADKRQAQAFEDSQSLLAQTDKVGKSMLDQDNSAFDLNSELKGNVYLNKQNPSNFTGHCTSDSKGSIDKLEAEAITAGGSETFSVSVQGDRKTVHTVHTIEGSDGGALVEEQWAIFDGSKASFKKIVY